MLPVDSCLDSSRLQCCTQSTRQARETTTVVYSTMHMRYSENSGKLTENNDVDNAISPYASTKSHNLFLIFR